MSMDDYLTKRAKELMIGMLPLNSPLVTEIFMYDALSLDSTPSNKISQYTIGASQFLIYFQFQTNMTKVRLMRNRKYLDNVVMTTDVKGSRLTKSEKRRKIIDDDENLKRIEFEISVLEEEALLTEDIAKHIVELINAFKRELTRREFEQQAVRTERRF